MAHRYDFPLAELSISSTKIATELFVQPTYSYQLLPAQPDFNCSTICCTISKSGQLAANFHICLIFFEGNPVISGKAPFKSLAIQSITSAPHPSF